MYWITECTFGPLLARYCKPSVHVYELMHQSLLRKKIRRNTVMGQGPAQANTGLIYVTLLRHWLEGFQDNDGGQMTMLDNGYMHNKCFLCLGRDIERLGRTTRSNGQRGDATFWKREFSAARFAGVYLLSTDLAQERHRLAIPDGTGRHQRVRIKDLYQYMKWKNTHRRAAKFIYVQNDCNFNKPRSRDRDRPRQSRANEHWNCTKISYVCLASSVKGSSTTSRWRISVAIRWSLKFRTRIVTLGMIWRTTAYDRIPVRWYRWLR